MEVGSSSSVVSPPAQNYNIAFDYRLQKVPGTLCIFLYLGYPRYIFFYI